MECSFYSTQDLDYITVTNMFPDLGRDAGDPFQFYVSRLRNSISQSPIPFELITFESVIRKTDENESILGGKIDSGYA